MGNRFLKGSSPFSLSNLDKLESVLIKLKLNTQNIQFISSSLKGYPSLSAVQLAVIYSDLLHLFLLNPQLRTNKKGEDLVKILFTCWYHLFENKSTRQQNEKILKERLQILVDFYQGNK